MKMMENSLNLLLINIINWNNKLDKEVLEKFEKQLDYQINKNVQLKLIFLNKLYYI